MKLAIVGPYPPPYGGISIHIQRMKSFLASKNIDCVVYTSSSREEDNVIDIGHRVKWMCKYLFTAKEDVIHFHYSGWACWMLVALMKCRGKKAILTLHGAGLADQLDRSDELRRGLAWPAIRFMMDHISFIVVVNPHVKELLISIGINPNKVSVIPAFVAPIVRQEDIDEIPNDIWRFIEEHNPIISANASQIVLYKDEDLYGIDMCIDLCAMLKESYENIGFVFVLPNVGNYEYFGKMQDRIKTKGIGDNFLFIKQQYQFYPILMKSDLFVRPTITDGDSISVRESLHFAVPVVASDAVQRPNGTILFENRNLDDFYEKVKNVLEHCQDYRKEAEEIRLENHAEHLFELYKKLGCMGSH